VRTLHHGQPLTLLRGRLDGDRRETALYTGEVPPEPPSAQDWSAEAFRFVDFAPRRLEPGRPGQHIRLDQAVEFLLGDKLR
jgi:predicted YcjX-like family ATPase